ncbi:MAG: SPOR domain-containing protein [Wenzhouxiangella sp.]|jgi:cell division protein FtsN|nr:SPOR domain-containing protein [Wenzhouxiangella sp.]
MPRKQARRGSGGHGLLWFASGLVCGLVLATVVILGGVIPGARQPMEPVEPSGRDEPPIAESEAPARARSYEFFTVLPEIEVVVPDREIEQRARGLEPAADAAADGPYLLQVGSFRNAGDAEGLRAQVTLLGLSARVQNVTVDDNTWHRVRVGPFDTARAADEARRRLLDNGFEAMVLSGG